MADFTQYFLMKPEDAIAYSKEVLHFFEPEDELECREIGDGNINYVFEITRPSDGRSLVIKQADTLLRSSGRVLDMHRNAIEAQILKVENDLVPGFVPEVYLYDETMSSLSMENISAYKNLRKEILANRVYSHLGDNISTFLAESLLPTTDLILDPKKKKEAVKFFTNPDLCDISEDLVFTKPYGDYKGFNHNIITPGNEEFVEKTLYSDKALHLQIARLRDHFMNYAQALIHGDFHGGHIFANEEGIKVIDPEFAFYGPMGYDIGNVIGNLCFPWANKACTDPGEDDEKAIEDTKKCIEEIFDMTWDKLSALWDKLVTFPLYCISEFKEQYLADVMADSLGYAGTEMIRRTVGDSKVPELDMVTDPDQKIPMERALVVMGVWLVMNRKEIKKGSEITEKFSTILDERGDL